MKPVIYYRLIPLILAIWQTDGAVNVIQIGTKIDDAIYECGTELLLSCHIDQYFLSMKWQNDSSALPTAECILTDCTLEESLKGLFEFTSNTSTGIFNLTIIQVSFDNDNVIYTCSDDKNNDISSSVRVKDYEPTIDDSTPEIITTVSGCIDQSTKVTLEWRKVMNGTGEETEHVPKNIISPLHNSTCTGDMNCVRSYFSQISMSISETPGVDYQLKVVFIYDGVRVESRLTNRTYALDDCPVCVCDDCSDCCILLIVAGCAYLIHIFLGLRLFVTWKDKYNSTEDKYFASSFEYHIVLCDLLWIVMFTLYIASIIICYECDCLCSKIVRVVGIIFLTLLGIHIILGCILLYVLYCRKITVVENDKCSTSKGTFIRSVCSAIPVAGLFAVCHWLISVCCSERHVMHNKTKDPLEKGRTEKKGSKQSETFPNLSPKKSGRKMSKSAQRRENKKIDKHLSTERSDLSGKGETDKVSTSGVILKKKTNDKNDFSMSKDSSTAVETARNNVPPYSTAHHNEKGIRSENRSDNGGIVTNSSSKKKKKTSRTKHDTSGDLHKPFSTEEQTSTSHGNVKHVNVLDLKKKYYGSPSPSTEKSSNPSKSHITSPNSTKEDQIKSHSAEEYAKSETMTRALSANFTDDDDDTAEVSDDRSKTLNMANTTL